MPLDEGNGIHIKRDFLLGRGELKVAASGSCFCGHLLIEGMQEQERLKYETYRYLLYIKIWIFG